MESKAPNPKHGGNLGAISVAVFVLMSLSAVFYLYYQNQQLKNILANYQTIPSPTAQVLPTPNVSLPIVTSPTEGSVVSSPLKVKGTVPTGWMFEGTFPVKLLDSSQKVIAQGQGKEVTAGAWQSGSPVDFTATFTFKTATGSGTLVLENDNPSGNPANTKTFKVAVAF